MSTCVNKNNGNVTRLSEITGLPAAAIAAKIAIWQSNGNEGKIPTHVDLGMPFLPWSKNIDIYKQYNLLNIKGTIKELSESDAKKWAATNNGSPEYYFEAKLNASRKWVISIAKRLWDKRDDGQLALFNKTEGDMLPNQIVINILNKLKDRFKVDYEIISPAQAEGLLSNTRDGYNNETGFYFNNKVYVVDNGNGLDLDSAIHEYGHPFMRALNKYNPSLFQNIVADLLATTEGKQIRQEVIDLKYTENEQAEEIAVRALTLLAKKDYNLKTGNLFEKVMDKLLRFLTTMLKDVFGRKELKLSTLSAETSLQTLADIFNLKQGVVDLNETVNIKPGVPELFDSNPELANAVYESLGFGNNLPLPVNKEIEFLLHTEKLKINLQDITLEEEGNVDLNLKDKWNTFTIKAKGKKLGYIQVKYKDDNTVKIGLSALYEGKEEVKQSIISKILDLINNIFKTKKVETSDKKINVNAGKGVGKLAYELLAVKLKREYQKELISDTSRSDYAENLWRSFEKQGKAEVIGKTDTQYRWDYYYKFNVDNQITPQQKQQAQQLYSQYLDTIFPEGIQSEEEILQMINKKLAIRDVFESNPELANAVYEALGVEVKNFRLILNNKKHPENANTYDVIYNDEKIGVVALFEGKNKIIKGVKLDEKFRNKGLGKKLYRFLNLQANLQGGILFSDPEQQSADARRLWNSLIKEGVVNRATADEQSLKFNIDYKQQAQQLYSQYLSQNPNGNVEQFKNWVDEFNSGKRTPLQPTEEQLKHIKPLPEKLIDQVNSWKNKSNKEILNTLKLYAEIYAKDKELENLIQVLIDNIDKIKFVKFKGIVKLKNNNHQAEYNGETGEIFVNNIMYQPNNRDIEDRLYRTIIHEYLHGYFLSVLNSPTTTQEKELVEYINEAYDVLTFEYEGTEKWYGFHNVDEFVSELLSNKEFRESEQIKKTGIVQKILNFINQIFFKKYGKNSIEIKQNTFNKILENISILEPSLVRYSSKKGSLSNFITQKSQERLNQIQEIFNQNPELSKIGTLEQYAIYLDTIFPDSKVKDIVYHGSPSKFEGFLEDNLNYFGTKEIAKGHGKNLYPVLIEINKPYYEDGGNLSNQSYEDLYDKLDESGSDGFISNGKNLFVPKTEEQIHRLGGKQDIEGFKEFVRGQKNDKVAFNKKAAPKTQKEIYDTINPVGKITKEGDEYVVLGEKGYKRVTSITQKNFGLGNKDTEMSQFLGNLFHAVAANAVKEAFPDFNKHFKTIEFVDAPDNKQFNISTLPNVSKSNILAIIKPVIEAAKKQGSVLSAELMTANTKTKIAGTIDLLEITKNGEVKSLDYKTSMNKGTTKSNYKKLLGNSEQQILYKKILDYDDVNLGREGINVKYQELMKIVSYMKDGIPTFKVLETSPVIYQTSLDKRKNEMLAELFTQIKMLDNKKDKSNFEKINALMETKLKLMQNIQKGVKDSEMLSIIMEDLIAIEVFMSENKSTNNYIEFRKDLSIYENIGSFVNITKENTALIEKVQGRAKRLYQQMYDNIEENFAKNAAKDLSFEGSIINSPEDVIAPVKDINTYQANFKGASYVSNPIVAYIYKTVSTAIAKARKKSSEMSSKINKAVKNLENYMGVTGEKIYEPLLQYLNGKPTGYLVDKYSSNFYEERKNAKKNGDLNWFKENTFLDTEAYNKKKKNYIEFLSNKFNADLLVKIESLKKSKKYKEEIIENEAKKYVTKDHTLALNKWTKDNNNIMLFNIPTDKWVDSKWKDIKEGKYKGTPVEEFYDMYTSAMESIEDFVPFDIRKNYIAEFKRSFMERIITNGVGDMRLGESLVNSISMASDDSYLEINPFTGKYVRNIPILGKIQIPFKNKKSFVENEKSYDLGKSLTIFFESAMRYHELSLVEHVHETGRDILLNQKEQILTASGEKAKGGFNLSKTAKGLENTINSLDYFIQSTVYGKSTDEGSSFNVQKESFVGKVFDSLGMMGDKTEVNLSSVKLLDSILRYTGLNNLGYNLYSPITNLLGGKSMQLLMGVGGRWYSSKDYGFASAVVTLGPFSNLTEDARKARLFIDMFQLQSSEYAIKEKENNSTGFKAFSKIPGPMSGMTSTESHMQNAGLIAMIKSDKHSIKWSDWKVVNDELKYIGETIPDEGVTEAFRQKVIHVNGRALGNMNPDDKIKIKQFFLGRAITQHRGWIPAMLESHWSSKKYNYVLGEYVEGRFNTLIRFVTVNKLDWKNLSNEDKANVKEACAEIFIILMAYALYAAVAGADDDKERRKKLKYLLKVLSRYKSEMMFFSGFGYSDMHKILISPAPSISTIEKFGRLIGSIKDTVFGEKEDLEKSQKRLSKNVGQMIPYWSQGSRFFDDLTKTELNEVK